MAVPLALSLSPACAQSTGSEQIETVVVTGFRANLSAGLASSTTASKQTSAITQDFIETQNPGQTFFEDLNALPGVNFDNSDAYGSAGGNISMHGQDDNHISVTIDGIPLNDTGNYAMYTNQMVDPELITRVSVNQSTTDVDSPTAAVTGGSIAVRTARPYEEFGLSGTFAGGSDSFKRLYLRADSGEFGPWNTRAFVTGSYTNYDQFYGYGQIDKKQINAALYQDMGGLGWMMLSAHFNRNRNDFYQGYYNYSIVDGIAKVDPDIWADSTAYSENCDPGATPVNGHADKTFTNCRYWYKVKINPSDTGNIRFSSLWNLLPNLTMTVDASLQYVLANGGGATTVYENMANYPAYYSPGSTLYYSIALNGVDLNGDGDTMDQVALYTPSNTNTRRWGLNTSFIYQLTDSDLFRMAYTMDYGIHRQTGQVTFMSPTDGVYNVFSGWEDRAHQVITYDGSDLRKRDRLSHAILNQVSMEYDGKFVDGMVHTNIGFRVPFFQRDLEQYCFTHEGDYNVVCTDTVPYTEDPSGNGLVTFDNDPSHTKFAKPGTETVYYSRFLPHVGVSFKPFGETHLFYANFTQELAAPKTDYLYHSTGSLYGGVVTNYTAFEDVKPETSTAYTLGYRYLGDDLNASIALWNNQVKNRIVSSYDDQTQTSYDRNIAGINYAGVDFDVNYRVLDNLLVYASTSYTQARITADVPMGTGITAATKNKQMTDTPKWTVAGRIQYKPIPELKIGFGGKYKSSRYGTEDNAIKVPDFVVFDADVSYDFDQLGLAGTSLRFNVRNIFDRKYYSGISTQTCYTGSSPCGYTPTVYLGAPRSFTVTLSTRI